MYTASSWFGEACVEEKKMILQQGESTNTESCVRKATEAQSRPFKISQFAVRYQKQTDKKMSFYGEWILIRLCSV